METVIDFVGFVVFPTFILAAALWALVDAWKETRRDKRDKR